MLALSAVFTLLSDHFNSWYETVYNLFILQKLALLT